MARTLHLTVNGSPVRLEVEPRRTLVEVLREDLELTGTKLVCDRASCGACTVLLDGRPIFSCHLLALQANGRRIETIEGVARGGELHPLQQAFIDRDAVQCGFCTPGMIMALKNVVDGPPVVKSADLARAISGNICRCGAYHHILEAALQAARR